MPFDLQSILAMLTGGGGGQGAPSPVQAAQGAPTGTQQTASAASGAAQQPGGLFSAMGLGGNMLPMALMGAGGQMLNASGPSRTPTNFGQVLGRGMSGFLGGAMQGQQFDDAEKQNLALRQMANIVNPQGGNANMPTLPGGNPAVPNFMMNALRGVRPNPMAGMAANIPPPLPGGVPSALGAMPTGAPGPGVQSVSGGGLPFGGPMPAGGAMLGQGDPNSFLRMMALRQRGFV